MVRKGDMVANIAKRFHSNTSEIVKVNKLHAKTFKAYPGKVLLIPLAVRPKVWDPTKADNSPNAYLNEDRRPTTDYEIITDFFDEYIKEDFLSIAEAQEDSIQNIKIGEHLARIDKRINYLSYKIDSLKQVEFAFNYNEREVNSVLDKMRRARDRYYLQGPIGKEIDSLTLVKAKLGEHRSKIRAKITDYEYLVDNADYNERNFEKEHKNLPEPRWGEQLSYESDYKKHKAEPLTAIHIEEQVNEKKEPEIAAIIPTDMNPVVVFKTPAKATTPVVVAKNDPPPPIKDPAPPVVAKKDPPPPVKTEILPVVLLADTIPMEPHHTKVDFAQIPKRKWGNEIISTNKDLGRLGVLFTRPVLPVKYVIKETPPVKEPAPIVQNTPAKQPAPTKQPEKVVASQPKHKEKHKASEAVAAVHKDNVKPKLVAKALDTVVKKAVVQQPKISPQDSIEKVRLKEYNDSIAFVLRSHPHIISVPHISDYKIGLTALGKVLDTQWDTTISRREKKVNTDPLASYKSDSNFIMTTIELKDIPIVEYRNKPKYLIPVDSISRIKAEFYLIRARQTLEKGDFKAGDKFIRKSLDLNPNNADAWMLHADLFLTTGAADKALKEYVISSEIDSTRSKVFYNIALLYAKANDDQKAYKYFSKATDVNDKYLLAYMGRASLLMDQRDFEGAIEDFTKVLKINKYYSPAFKGRGLARMEVRRFTEAVTDFNQYLEIEDPDGYIIFQRGLSKVLSSNLLQGCLDFSSAQELGFKDAEKAIKRYCQ